MNEKPRLQDLHESRDYPGSSCRHETRDHEVQYGEKQEWCDIEADEVDVGKEEEEEQEKEEEEEKKKKNPL